MEVKNNNIVKLVLTLFFVIHIIGIAFIFYYQNNVNIFSRLKITSDEQLKVFIITPLNTRAFVGHSGRDTLVIEKRPLKGLEIIKNDKKFFINKDNLYSYNLFAFNFKFNIVSEINKPAIITTAGWLFFNLNIWAYVFIFYLTIISWLLYLKRKFIHVKLKRIKIIIFRWLLRSNTNTWVSFTNNRLGFKPYQKMLVCVLFLMICFNLFYNLGKFPLNHTSLESRRALVAMEMKISGNYIAPTICGQPYLNKFPLGHLIYVPFLKDNINIEGSLRAIAMSFILFCCLIIFFFIKRIKNSFFLASLTSLAFMGSFFVLFFKEIYLYQFFTMICLLLFSINYCLFKANRFFWLFLFSYFITFIGFLTKGYVMLYFNWISLFVLLWIHNQFRLIVSWKHFSGVLLFLLLSAGYFVLYSRYFNTKEYLLQQVLEIDKFSDYDVIARVKSFTGFWGFNMVLFSPILVFFPLLFIKRHLLIILKDKFSSYLFFVSVLGIGIFWCSPEYMPYYILMFIPLIMFLLINLILNINIPKFKHRLYVLLIILIFSSSVFLFPDFSFWRGMEFFIYPFICCLPSFFLIVLPANYRLNTMLFSMFFVMLFLMISKHDFSQTEKDKIAVELNSKNSAKKIIKFINNKPMLVYSSETKIQNAVVFYLEYYGGKIIRVGNPDISYKDTYFLANKNQIKTNYMILDSIPQYVFSTFRKDIRKTNVSYYPIYLIMKQ